MRVLGIFLLVALIAGGIAMLGNQLGRKIGRKKMTIFGMRPRHTSIFITTITGSLIAVLTLGLAMVGSRDVRDLVTGSLARVEKLLLRERELVVRVQELAEKARVGTIVWNYEERIALNTIPAKQDKDSVKRIVASLLKVANAHSIGKNNALARSGDQILGVDRLLLKYTQYELQGWLKEYTQLDTPVGLWVVARENCLIGDPVPIRLESFPVKRIYKKGEVVYSTDIAPSEVLLEWHIFLRSFKDAALRKGMIEINDSLGGEIDAATLRKISKATVDSKGSKAKVRLRVVANRDLYQSSNLDVSIQVKALAK